MSDGRTARSRPSTRTGRLIRRPMRPTGRVWRFELMARKVGAATTAVNRHGPALRRRFVGRARRPPRSRSARELSESPVELAHAPMVAPGGVGMIDRRTSTPPAVAGVGGGAWGRGEQHTAKDK